MAAAERSAYDELGVSSDKAEVHAAVEETDAGLYPGAFCRVGRDVLTGDPAWCSALHADGAGTKALVAYLMYREQGDPTVFRRTAQDALVMNLDDLACVGATGPFLLSNTIGRNPRYVGGDALRAIIAGYDAVAERLRPHGVEIISTGGETADLPDAVRTLIVDAAVAVRWPSDRVIDNARIRPGDVIVGLSSTGQASYEDAPNSGIGANGLTLARHVLLANDYARRYPESVDPDLPADKVYRGPFRVEDLPTGLGMSVGAALTSPTRTYVPVVRALLAELASDTSGPGLGALHGMVHCTGGGQTKCVRFGSGVCFVKDQPFPIPPLFELLREEGGLSWRDMVRTFNCGHRFELFVLPECADLVLDVAGRFGIEAKVIGRCEPSEQNRVVVHTPGGVEEFA